MASKPELKIRIGAELTEIKNALRQVQGDIDKLGRSGRTVGQNATGGFNAIEGAVKRAGVALSGFLTVYAAIGAVRAIANITDDYARFNAQLKLTTGSTEEFVTAQREVFRIAQETRAPVADVANTYATLARSTEVMGASQEELVNVLETVNKAIALTPVSAETARATLVQFGQALSGDFKAGAQEMNSILEQTPGLARAIAQGLGVAVGDLKRMGEAGELSAEKVFKALQSVGTSIDEQFREIPLTVSGALTQLQNDVLVTFGNTDVTPLTDAISDLRETLTDPAVVQGLTDLASALVRLTGLAAEAASEFANLGRQFGYFAAYVTGNTTTVQDLEKEIEDIDRALNNSVMGKPIKYLFADPEELEREKAALQRQIDLIQRWQGVKKDTAEDTGNDASRQALADQAKAELDAAKAAQEKAKADEEARKAAEARQKQIDGVIQGLTDEAATYGKTAEEVVRYRLALLGATQAEQDRGAALARQVEELKAKEQAEKDAVKAAEERAEAERKLAEDIEEIRIRSLELSGNNVEARAAELARQYEPILAQLRANFDTAGEELVRSLINTELAQTRLNELQGKIQAVTDRVGKAEESVENRVAIGDISGAEGQEELRAAREQAITELQALRAEFEILATEGAPGAAEALANVDAQIANLAGQNVSGAEEALRRMRTELAQLERSFAGGAIDAATDALADGLYNIVTGAETASEAFRNMARAFLASLARMAADALAKRAILAIVGAATGTPTTATVAHTGAIIGGAGGTRRTVPSFAFAGAPRYHSGGIAGLKPGEVPAILQTGEEVLSRKDPRNSLNGAGQASGGNGVRVINVVDPDLVQDYLASSEGERTIMNVIQRNAGAVKQTLS
jgi:tape measure domain-containing protein